MTSRASRSTVLVLLALPLVTCGGGGSSPPGLHTLSVVTGGPGTGTVTGGGVDCGATCTASLADGTAVTLTAVPAAGSTFAGWTGCDAVSGATCSVTLGTDRTVTATFAQAPLTLDVLKSGAGAGTVTGGGLDCGATCSVSLAPGSAVTLTATAAPGSTFAGWSGCDATAGATCDVTMTADRVVTASFDGAALRLTVQKAGAGAGAVTGGGLDCGATCDVSLAPGASVTLTATAAPGSTFAGWSGCDAAAGATCDVTMTADRVVTASFAQVQRTLTVQRSGAGAGSVAGGAIDCGATCTASLADGSALTLTATPAAGSAFAGWTGCDVVSGATCSLTMTGDRLVTASFAQVQHFLHVLKSGAGAGTVAGGGVDCGAACSVSYAAGAAVTLTATPAAGSTFAFWTGCDTVSGATCAVTMGADRTVTAAFDLAGLTLGVLKSGAGAGTVTGGGLDCGAVCSVSLLPGAAVTLTATAAPGSTFAGWSGCDAAAGATCDVTMTANRVVTASFDGAAFTLTVQKSGAGAGAVTGAGLDCGATCGVSLAGGATVTLTATPDARSTFAGWTGCDAVVGGTCSVTMTADRVVTAAFAPVQRTLNVQRSGAGAGAVTGGTIDCGATCTASLADGAAVTLTATPAAGSTFAGWAGCDAVAGSTCDLTMNADRTVTATFEPVRFTLGVQLAGAGAGVVTGGGIDCGATCSVSLPSGAAVTLTAAPTAGSTFAGWTGCDGGAGATCDVTLAADRTVTATFDLVGAPGTLEVVNLAGFAIAELYASPAGANAWLVNLLTTPIAPGGTATVAGLAAGSYDLRAVAPDGFSHLQAAAFAIPAGGVATWTLQPPAVGSLDVTNSYCLELVELTLEPASGPAWSANLLAAPVAPGGGTVTLPGLPAGAYDARAVASDGVSWILGGFTIPSGAGFAWTIVMPAGTGCFTLQNNNGTLDTIAHLYAPPSPQGCTGNAWGNDLLAGLASIPPGGSFTIGSVQAGPHDFRALGTTALGEVADYRICGFNVPPGGTFTWWFTLP